VLRDGVGLGEVVAGLWKAHTRRRRAVAAS
jgi:hypothetical protein